MTPERWRQIEELYHVARDRGPAVLADTDPELRLEVERLLAQHSAGKILDLPVSELLQELPITEIDDSTGAHVPSSREAFSPGAVVANRFRIVGSVGGGGMGMVYEAVDQTLDRRVAIKCAKAGHQMSLPPEVRAAREVSHFNVCKVHDLHTVTTGSGEVSFLSMEFVEGETLSERIKRDGALKRHEALGIARQICAGLGQAHRQGVIHGDLKTGNVILAKVAEGGTRAVITDFGLAKFVAPDGSRIASELGGTPDYMAPELLLGEPPSVASDIYALGVLLHAMLTTRTPQRAPAGTAESRQATTPPQAATSDATTVTMAPRIAEADRPRCLNELPQPWKDVIGNCLEPKPARRYGSAQLVVGALEPRRTALKWGGVAAVVVASGLGYWQWSESPPGEAIRLAVLPFSIERNAGADLSAVAEDIAERLSGARRNFTVITPLEARQNQVDTPEKARSILGATHALETRLTTKGVRIAAAAQLVNLDSGKAVRVLQSTYPAGQAAALAKALIGMVSVGLSLKSRAPQEPVTDIAYPAYVQGLNTFRQDPRMADEAIPLLERAIALDPGSALPYAVLALAETQKFRNGDGRQWLEHAAETAEKATGINPDSVQVLLASGLVDQLSGRYEQAVFAISRAVTLDPGNPTVWRLLAETYQLEGRDEEAVQTYRKAIESEPGGYLPYLNFGNYYYTRNQYRQAEEMYRKVTALAPRMSSGHMNLGVALKQQGRYQEAEQSLLKALSLRPSARLLLNIGAVYYEQEQYSEALRFFQESAKQGAPTAALDRNLGDAYRHLHRPKEAVIAYRAGRDMSEEEVATNPRASAARAQLALLMARLGDTQRASYELSQALATDSGNGAVTADTVQALEILKQRDRAIAILQKAPLSLLEELNRMPDLTELRRDRRFRQLF